MVTLQAKMSLLSQVEYLKISSLVLDQFAGPTDFSSQPGPAGLTESISRPSTSLSLELMALVGR